MEQMGSPLTQGVSPEMQVVAIAALGWIVRELVLKQSGERQQRARAVLTDRLQCAYSPMWLIVGDILLLEGQGATPGQRSELRELLRTQGHHLRTEHYQFCLALLQGRIPRKGELLWHRGSVRSEIQLLKELLYGESRELEASLGTKQFGVSLPSATRLGDYLAAALIWVLLVGILAWIPAALHRAIPVNVFYVAAAVVLTHLVASLLFQWKLHERWKPTLLKAVRLGSRGQDVHFVQMMLQLLGYQLGPFGSDGVFGQDTLKAVKEFQRAMKVPESGKLDKRTRTKLYLAVRDLDV